MNRSSKSRRGFTLVELPAVSKRNRVAFTLVELLVVIGIIAVLIAILLPAISRARKQAATTACMATMRMIGQTLAIYESENKGSVCFGFYRSDAVVSPNANQVDEADPNTSLYIWWSVLRSYHRTGTALDNGAANSNGVLSSRGMKGMRCASSNAPDGGISYVPNMIAFPDVSYDSNTFNASVKNPLMGHVPAKQTQLYPDNILFWDVTEIPPTYGSQYVVGYEVAGSNFILPKRAYRRYRQMAAEPGVAGAQEQNDVFIPPGSNQDVTPGVDNGQLGNIRWRHGNNDSANFLFADGTVRTMKITKGTFGQPNFKGEVTYGMFRLKTPTYVTARTG